MADHDITVYYPGDLVPAWFGRDLEAEACRLLDLVAASPGIEIDEILGRTFNTTIREFCAVINGGYYLNCIVTEDLYLQAEPGADGLFRYVDRKRANRFSEERGSLGERLAASRRRSLLDAAPETP